jgi:hypothetical protein
LLIGGISGVICGPSVGGGNRGRYSVTHGAMFMPEVACKVHPFARASAL